MVGIRQTQAFRTDTNQYGKPLTAEDRERLLQPYLPQQDDLKPATPKTTVSQKSRKSLFHHRQRIRPALKQLIYSLLFLITHTLFTVYIRLRQLYHSVFGLVFAVLYYHHRTPELIQRDVRNLSKVPKHLSVLLELRHEAKMGDELETLLNDACELAAWTASSGIPMLSIYERTGVLKSCLPLLHRRISRTLSSYYGAKSPHKPSISLRAPHLPSYSPPLSPDPPASETHQSPSTPHLTILIIDATDGRQTLVDLTKTLTEMSQRGKLAPSDISADLIDAEICESIMDEPDLLIIFGPRVVLDGYPPWQIRLSEIFHAQDNSTGVGYQVFLRALYKYARAEFRLGR